MKQIIFFSITCLIIVSCKLNNSKFDAQKIIDKSIIASGSDKISSSTFCLISGNITIKPSEIRECFL